MKKLPAKINLFSASKSKPGLPRFKSHLYAGISGMVLAFVIICSFVAIPNERLTESVLTQKIFTEHLSPAVSNAAAQISTVDATLKQLLALRKVQDKVQESSLNENFLLASLTSEKLKFAPDIQTNSGSAVSAIASFPFVYPVMGPRKSSGYGLRVHPIRGFSSNHKGIDLSAPVGASIRAIAEGKVIFADPYAGYGNLVVLDHGNGITTHYGHCDSLSVHIGEKVKTGQVIAKVGSTGMSTGPHLHLEARVNGQPINPEKYFVGLADKAEG